MSAKRQIKATGTKSASAVGPNQPDRELAACFHARGTLAGSSTKAFFRTIDHAPRLKAGFLGPVNGSGRWVEDASTQLPAPKFRTSKKCRDACYLITIG